MLNYEFPPLGGGASPISFEMAHTYVKNGHQVDVVTMGFKSLPSFEIAGGVNIYRVNCLRSKKEICHPYEQLSYIFSAKKFLKKHLKNNDYDICHSHFVIPTGIIANWLKKRYKIPYIITSHGSDIPGYNPDRFKFLHKFTKPLIKKIANNSSGNFAGSQYLVNLANKLNLKKEYKVIREGFDSSKFKVGNKKDIILYTGRLLERKGAQYLIKAVSDKNIGYEVHIAGDGPMMSELQGLAKNSKTKIIFHGWLNNNSVEYKELLESSKIYVLTSERENSSVSLLEAMSAGCAVITSNVSGCPEVVGDAGFLVSPKNSLEIKNAIYKLVGNEEHYGNLARNRILNFYSWDKSINKYLEFMNRIFL
jgi:glycosyltransferase involved in cell wall biosynthesis